MQPDLLAPKEPHERKADYLYRAFFVFFSAFIFAQCLSISVANYFLGISVFLSVIVLIREYKKSHSLAFIWKERSLKYWLLLFGFFWATMFLSAIFSPEPLKGFQKFFNWYVYKTFPFFMILIFFRDTKKVLFFILLSLVSCGVDIVAGYFLMPTGATRMKGIFGHPMTLAGFLCVAMPVACVYLFDWKQKFYSLTGCAFLFLVYSFGLLLNGTRGAWIAIAPALLMVGLWACYRSWKKSFLLVLLCICAAVTLCSNERLEKRAISITSTTMQSNTERLLMWQSAWQMFKDHPVFGVGVGQYAKKYQSEYILPEAKERKQNHAHSNIFQMLAQSGAVGLIGFLTLFAGILNFGYKSARKADSPYGMLIVVCSLSLFIQGLTEFNFGNSAVLKYYLSFMACFVVLTDQSIFSSFLPERLVHSANQSKEELGVN